MRRIPRPSRAVDPSAAFQLPVRQRISPASCRALAINGTQSSTTTAAFSTTSPHPFLLSGKQDKKKHQQFVRRWQKRLLGDSEPIGAHVDPYDPTSPVRIAPEEQGEYEEVLEEHGDAKHVPSYVPAEHIYGDRPGVGLMRVGGAEWNQDRVECERAQEFERFTQKTYTPLTLDMADQIESLTGTPYTLRDENLYMAQGVHEATGRPYTRYDFGLHHKVTDPKQIRQRFEQAIIEVYTLKEAGLELDLSKAPNRGVYSKPKWAEKIKIETTETGELALAFPKYKSAKHFVRIIQDTPEWEASQDLVVEEVSLEDAADLTESVVPQESVPTMDPDTPAFKRAAVVKTDPEKKPFDFMSNRPTPRTNPIKASKVEEPAEAVVTVEETANVPAPNPLIDFVELESSVTASASTLKELRKIVLQHKRQRAVSQTTKTSQFASVQSSDAVPVKWRRVSIADSTLKFALFKRIFQLTGLYISDPHLTQSNTLGDLYNHLCAAAKPQPTSLFDAIKIEGKNARKKAYKQSLLESTPRRKADLGDLLRMGNVEIRAKKASTRERNRKIGLGKVIEYALYERGLQVPSSLNRDAGPAQELGVAERFRGVREGSREVPKFGKPVPSAVSTWLEKKTGKRIEAHVSGKA